MVNIVHSKTASQGDEVTPHFNRLQLEQTERAIAPFAALRGKTAVPAGGWLKALRESLGRSLRKQAERAHITAPSLLKAEASELTGGISLGQLRKLADSLDCELVYALVPKQPLSKVIESQADKLAREQVLGLAHSMSLEDQRPDKAFVESQIAERRRALLEGPWSRLWR